MENDRIKLEGDKKQNVQPELSENLQHIWSQNVENIHLNRLCFHIMIIVHLTLSVTLVSVSYMQPNWEV